MANITLARWPGNGLARRIATFTREVCQIYIYLLHLDILFFLADSPNLSDRIALFQPLGDYEQILPRG
jgi:hypothetical protein